MTKYVFHLIWWAFKQNNFEHQCSFWIWRLIPLFLLLPLHKAKMRNIVGVNSKHFEKKKMWRAIGMIKGIHVMQDTMLYIGLCPTGSALKFLFGIHWHLYARYAEAQIRCASFKRWIFFPFLHETHICMRTFWQIRSRSPKISWKIRISNGNNKRAHTRKKEYGQTHWTEICLFFSVVGSQCIHRFHDMR